MLWILMFLLVVSVLLCVRKDVQQTEAKVWASSLACTGLQRLSYYRVNAGQWMQSRIEWLAAHRELWPALNSEELYGVRSDLMQGGSELQSAAGEYDPQWLKFQLLLIEAEMRYVDELLAERQREDGVALGELHLYAEFPFDELDLDDLAARR